MNTKELIHHGTSYQVATTTRRYGNTFFTYLNSITNNVTGEQFKEALDPWNSSRIPKKDIIQLLP